MKKEETTKFYFLQHKSEQFSDALRESLSLCVDLKMRMIIGWLCCCLDRQAVALSSPFVFVFLWLYL